mmetsp:Transcript_22450/g.63159  ORF Transcript_22450/g.63159 Transcript_22450/m.63159 type:complete len:233 (-) Transcript_22450:157-855(-)
MAGCWSLGPPSGWSIATRCRMIWGCRRSGLCCHMASSRWTRSGSCKNNSRCGPATRSWRSRRGSGSDPSRARPRTRLPSGTRCRSRACPSCLLQSLPRRLSSRRWRQDRPWRGTSGSSTSMFRRASRTSTIRSCRKLSGSCPPEPRRTNRSSMHRSRRSLRHSRRSMHHSSRSMRRSSHSSRSMRHSSRSCRSSFCRRSSMRNLLRSGMPPSSSTRSLCHSSSFSRISGTGT